MLAKLRQGFLNVFHLEAEMFDANLTASTLSLRATFKNGEVDVAIGQKNTVEPQADLFETENLLVKGGSVVLIAMCLILAMITSVAWVQLIDTTKSR
jgi:hypothetical protein